MPGWVCHSGRAAAGSRQPFLAGVEELIDQILLGLDAPRNHVRDEPVGELMLGVKEAKHFVFLNDQSVARTHRHRSRDPQRLAHQAGFAQKIARPENGHDRLFARGGGYGDLYAALLNVEHLPGGLTLGKERSPLAEVDTFL